jgi:hypothetical protein
MEIIQYLTKPLQKSLWRPINFCSSRRKFLFSQLPLLISSFAVVKASPVLSVPNEGSPKLLRFRWMTPQSDQEVLRSQLKSYRAELESGSKIYKPADPGEIESSEFSPLVIIAGVISVAYLSEFIVNLNQDARHHGLIITERNGTLDIKENPSLNRGEILLLTAGSKPQKILFNKESRVDIEKVLTTLIK